MGIHQQEASQRRGQCSFKSLWNSGKPQAVSIEPTAGEFDLLDALNLMERGDYSRAVRRITTAIEAVVEAVLAGELRKGKNEFQVEQALKKTRNNFPERVRQYEKLSGRQLSANLHREMGTTRSIRNAIVHLADRIPFTGRGRAQRAVDTGRWIFNWFENNPARTKIREAGLATKSLGRHMLESIFDAELTADGVVVKNPLMS